MIGVYILHSLHYANTPSSIAFAVISPFYVNAFFVISGILFFRKWLNMPNEKFYCNLGSAYLNVFFRIFIPTILFSTIFFVPKLLYHSNDISINTYIYNVLGGTSFWFTSAMCVTQIVMLVFLPGNLMRCDGGGNILIFSVLSIVLLVVIYPIKSMFPEAFPWYWKTGLAAVSFMTIGGLIYVVRKKLKEWKYIIVTVATIVYVLLLYTMKGAEVMYALMSVRFNFIGTIITFSGIAFIISLCYVWNPHYKLLQFIGKNSIIFYFFSGILPASLSSISYLRSYGGFGISILGIAAGVILTWIVVNYLPFLADLRKIKCLKK